MDLNSLKSKCIAQCRERPGWVGGAAVVLLLVVWAALPGSKGNAKTSFYDAKRGDFLISIVEGGTIQAVNEVVVRSEVEGTARIIYIVPEGTYVKKGDLLVELDSSASQDQVNLQLISYEKANFALIQAREQLAIQKSAVDSDVSAQQLKVEFAKSDLQKYLEGEARQLKRNLEIEITTVKENLLLAEERLQWSEKLEKQGFETKSNLDKDRLTVSQYKLKLEQAEKELWMFDTFDYPKQKRQLESNVEQNTQELERVKLQGERKMAALEADVKAQESTTDLSKKKLERDQANLAACKITAPQGGLVVYAIGENRFSSESLIEEGATVRNRQEIIKLPDVSDMKLAVRIHESYVNMVKTGQMAYVVLDSMPDQRFRGVVRKVAILPDTQSRWGNPNLKVYSTEILLTDPLPNVKPGVSARAEIIITNLQDVVTVPLQAVTTRQGKQVAYVATGNTTKAVPVTVGMYNTKSIEIINGVREGDRVLLAPPMDTQEKDLGGAILAKDEARALTNQPPVIVPAPPVENAGAQPAPAVRTDNGASPEGRGSGGGGRFNREEMLKKFDRNGDGQLDDEERATMRAAMPPRPPRDGAQPPTGGNRSQ